MVTRMRLIVTVPLLLLVGHVFNVSPLEAVNRHGICCPPEYVNENNRFGRVITNWRLSPMFFFFSLVQQPPVFQDLVISKASRSRRHTTLGRTPLDEWSARRRDLYMTTQHLQQTDIHASGGIRTRIPSKRVAEDPRLRPHNNWYRCLGTNGYLYFVVFAETFNLFCGVWGNI